MTPSSQRWLQALGLLGPILLLAAAIVFGVTEVHSSTDTYIGLTGGRAIMESTTGFPVQDTHSFTFAGQTWFNQNWLTHLGQWWLYTTLGPDSVIWGTWVTSTLLILFSGVAVRLRTGSTLAALVAAAVVAIGFRDWISARPATTQFFLVSAFWMLICALESQRDRPRWWPIAALAPLLLIWGAAHGSFLFGYGLLAVYIAYWLIRVAWRRLFPVRAPWLVDPLLVLITLPTCVWVIWNFGITEAIRSPRNPYYGGAVGWTWIGGVGLTAALMTAFVRERRHPPALQFRQVVAIALVAILTVVITALIGPFGLHNFLHPFTVASTSEDANIWRSVGEWWAPYIRLPPGQSVFPPVQRFWFTVVCTAVALGLGGLAALAGWMFRARAAAASPPAAPDAAQPAHRPAITSFDVLVFAIGLLLTMFARRFAPFSLLFGAPLLATLLILLWRPILRGAEYWGRVAVMLLAWIALPFAAKAAWAHVDQTILRPWRAFPDAGLLEVVTSYMSTPHSIVEFMSRNELDANALAEWTHAGIVMFYAPRTKVFMDGRAQQVYTPTHYQTYKNVMAGDLAPLDQSGCDAVLVHIAQSKNQPLIQNIERQPAQWIRVFFDETGVVYLRAGSRPLQQLRDRMEAGRDWFPDKPTALVGRGNVWDQSTPRRPDRAVADWQAALKMQPGLAGVGDLLWGIAARLNALEGRPAVEKYMGELRESVRVAELNNRQRTLALTTIDNVLKQLDRLPNRANPGETP